MGRMKEILMEQQELHPIEDHDEISLDEDYIEWVESTHLKTQILSADNHWQEACINLRDYVTISPLIDPNRTKLSTGSTSIIINTPFIITLLKWKKVKSNR